MNDRSFGVLIYEMLAGVSPFFLAGSDQMSLFKRICLVKYQCPDDFSYEAEDLIRKLLRRQQATRFGNLRRGYLDVKDHEWFDSLDFDKLIARELEAPWEPETHNPWDSSHFEDFSKIERQKHSMQRLTEEEQKLFADF